MNISGHDLKIFSTVANEGSLTSGASVLGLTQPTVTRTLQRVESELQASLFVRSKKGVVLTRAGKHLLAESKKLLESFHALQEVIKNEEQVLQGQYRIGVHSDLAGHTLPKFIPELINSHSELEFKFVHDLSRVITKSVVDLELDFGIVVNPIRFPDLTIHKLYNDEIGFWVSKKHKKYSNVKKEGIPIICNPTLTQTTKLLKEIRKKGFLPKPRIIHITNLQLIADLIADGAGIGIVPKTTIELHHSQVVRQIRKLPVHSDQICLIYRHDMLRGTAGGIISKLVVEKLCA